jgi:hypothetical protein
MKEDMYLRFLKFFYFFFTIVLIPVYWYYYGPQNFLWLSDIGLFLTVIGLWTNSPLMISMAAVGVLFVELIWNVDFFAHLLFNSNMIDLADYMFDSSYPLILRAISLFHVINPVIWIWYLAKYGYDKRALYYFTALYWIVMLLTYSLTQVKENINWVFWPQIYSVPDISPSTWLAILCICFPLLIFLPSHYLYRALFKSADS